MGDKIVGWIEKIATGEKRRIFWALIILLLIVIYVAFPFIDAHFLIYNRIEQRIDNLSKLVSINGKPLETSESLTAEYQSILREMESARYTSENGSIGAKDSREDYVRKYIGGSLLGLLMAIVGLFTKNPNGKMTLSFFIRNNFMTVVVGGLVAIVCGYISTFIPTIGSVWVNVIASPIIQFILFDLLLSPSR